jgi:hypothetical protein
MPAILDRNAGQEILAVFFTAAVLQLSNLTLACSSAALLARLFIALDDPLLLTASTGGRWSKSTTATDAK